MIADIDTDSETRRMVAIIANHTVHKLRQQRGREVVCAVVVEIFKRAKGHTLTRAGQAADDDQSWLGGCAVRFAYFAVCHGLCLRI